MADPAAGAALVLDDDVASELLGEMGGKRAGREVGRAAGRKRHHDRDRAGRPGLLRVQAAVLEHQGSRHERKPG